MSKAFTKEIENEDDEVMPCIPDSLPLGAKNYITPQGHAALVDELKHLRTKERPEVVEVVAWTARNGDRSENGDYIYGKKCLREIDRRIQFLMMRLDNADVVDQAKQKGLQQILFGAPVTYETDEGGENTIQIVDVDEAKTEDGQVSWISPIARSLHKSRVGDLINLKTPAGMVEIEIVDIRY